MRKKYTAIIVDDEPQSIRTLKKQLGFVDLDIEIIGSATNEQSAQELIQQNPKFDFLFLDIELGNTDGFELLAKFDLEETHLIFVTAYDEYALKAFRHLASGYLTKPVSIDQLEELLLHLVRNSKSTRDFHFKTKSGMELIDQKTILYAQADGSYTKLYLKNGETKVLSKNLKNVSEELNETDFLRIHSKYLVQLDAIKQIKLGVKSSVLLDNGEEIPASRTHKEKLKELYFK
ncbi:LytR/AlgR family response regulator transcription factor [Jiulongibacter sp. NS-SX5]|uniref:LytR/AlgR family response regulator transcription factor n=1 Tax=Jiulongibacter sp. NS-SX5 TaxID=3463854 RepID=UPI0040580934